MVNGARPRCWTLKLGEDALAELRYDSFETPWLTVLVVAEAGFERFRGYFGELDDWPDADLEFDAMVAEVEAKGGFTLAAEDGEVQSDFTLVNVEAKSGVLPELANLRI